MRIFKSPLLKLVNPYIKNFSTISPLPSPFSDSYVSRVSRGFVSYFFNGPYTKYDNIQLLLLNCTETFFKKYIDDPDFDEDMIELDFRVLNSSAAEVVKYFEDDIEILNKRLYSNPDIFLIEYESVLHEVFLRRTS